MSTTGTEIEVLPPIIELTPDEAWADFDAMAQKHLDMTGEEFLRRLDAGEFAEIVDDPANHPRVGILAQLSLSVR